MPEDERINRRRFFRAGLIELLRPLTQAAESLTEAAAMIGAAEQKTPTSKPEYLRPPGALAESNFASTCSRCGDCVSVCPVKCIRIETDKAGGLPFIDVDSQPCVLCDGLKCMHACPTGALVPMPLNQIDMGTAVWQESCLRQQGQACTICVDSCPVGSYAIELSGKRIRVHEHGCTGCGVCQHDCPTTPKSIIVQLSSDRLA